MQLDIFTSLSADAQLDIIQEIGVLAGKREHPNHYIHLYRVYSFYAEVFFRKKDDTVWKVGGFDHPVLLKPYLDQIDLSSLMKES